jgi:propionyl-CoA carboxylase alpha chain
MESRLYAEDPYRNFLPSIGRLTRYRPPAEVADATHAVRNDTGVFEGGEISMYYDPMIAKLITSGPDRGTATAAMLRALDAFQIRGVEHNIPFLAALMGHPRFAEGRLTTNFIAEEFPDGFHSRALDPDGVRKLLAVAASLQQRRDAQARTISGQLPGQGRVPRTDWVVRVDRTNQPVSVSAIDGGADVIVGDVTVAVRSAWVPGDTLWTGTVEGMPMAVPTLPATAQAARLLLATSPSHRRKSAPCPYSWKANPTTSSTPPATAAWARWLPCPGSWPRASATSPRCSSSTTS